MHGDARLELRYDPSDELPLVESLDVALAVGAGAVRIARAVGRPVTVVAGGVLRLARRVPPVALRRALVAELAADGAILRGRLERVAAESFRILLRRSVEAALTAIDLTALVRNHLDLNAVAGDLDVDAVVQKTDVVAVVDRMDLDAIVAGIDLDAVLGRIDIDTLVKAVDLDAVLASVDLDTILSRVDLDEVAARIDLDAILSRVDLDEVAARIDLDALISRVEPDKIVARVDLDAVIGRLDLAALAREVIGAIDLPDIVRASSGAVSSQAARTVRSESMQADESVSRWVDRVLRRPHPGAAVTP